MRGDDDSRALITVDCVDSGDIDTVLMEENDARAEKEISALTVIPVIVANTVLEAVSDGLEAVAMLVMAADADVDELCIKEVVARIEFVHPIDFDDSSEAAVDCVGINVEDPLIVLLPERLRNVVIVVERVFVSDI